MGSFNEELREMYENKYTQNKEAYKGALIKGDSALSKYYLDEASMYRYYIGTLGKGVNK